MISTGHLNNILLLPRAVRFIATLAVVAVAVAVAVAVVAVVVVVVVVYSLNIPEVLRTKLTLPTELSCLGSMSIICTILWYYG